MVAGSVAVLLWVEAQVQAQEFQLDQYHPAELARDGFSVRRPTSQRHFQLGAQLQLAYSLNPLVVEAVQGNADSEQFSIVDHQLTGHVLLSLGLWDHLVIFGHLPVVLLMDGNQTFAGLSADDAGLGDVAVGMRLRLLGDEDDLFGLAVQAKVMFPTANSLNEDQQLTGDSSTGVYPEVIAELRPGPLHITANLGARVRSVSAIPTVGTGSELSFALGASLPLHDGSWQVRGYAEVFGLSTLDDFLEREETSLELLGGIKAISPAGWVAGLAAGPGLGRGEGTPDLRVIAMLGFQPWPEPSTPATNDRCPNEEEDRDGFEDEDGCPDPDNDQDEILDAVDDCPMDPEDYDGFEDEDGCPDPDNDNDGYIDASDACPFQAGQGDGCPDIRPVITVSSDRIQFPKVFFETDQDRILPESLGILAEVARTLNDHPDIEYIRIEGHTDKRGSHEYNQDLSLRRANSVMKFLVRRGVEDNRMEAKGYGFDQPIFKGAKTLKQYAMNRRVEIIILKMMTTAEDADRELRIEENQP